MLQKEVRGKPTPFEVYHLKTGEILNVVGFILDTDGKRNSRAKKINRFTKVVFENGEQISLLAFCHLYEFTRAMELKSKER